METKNVIDPAVVKAMSKSSREAYGFVAPRIYENKKKYKRSRDKKIDMNYD